MRYVAAYLLAVLGGNNSPSKEDISKILGSIGLDIDEDKLGKVVLEYNCDESCQEFRTPFCRWSVS